MTPSLSDRQLRFIFEYLQDHNASAAAVRAGYSEASKYSAAHDLMNHPGVQARLREEMQGLLAELRCSALQLMKERVRAAFFRADKMFKRGWEVRTLDEMDEETRAALEVTTVMRKSGPVTRIKQPDRDRALRALEKVHERLDRLNEKYWVSLEKEGRILSLEEIEAMDGGGTEPGVAEETRMEESAAGKGVEKVVEAPAVAPTVCSPAASAPASARDFPKKPQGFSGSPAQRLNPWSKIGARSMVFSGYAPVPGLPLPGLPHFTRASPRSTGPVFPGLHAGFLHPS